MSLIPSESYSFPDHFTRTVTPSRKPKNEESDATSVRTARKNIVPLPSPRMQPPPAVREKTELNRNNNQIAAPNPALRRASAPPPRIPERTVGKQEFPSILKPKAAVATRAPAMGPASLPETSAVPSPPAPAPALNVIQMPAARVMPVSPAPIAQRPTARQSSPPVFTNSQSDFFERFAQTGDSTLAKRRRKMKMKRFIVSESVALAVLVPLATIGIVRRPDNVILIWILNISTIAAAFAAALILILFYAATPTLPEIER